jgi:molybdopterin-guanine dinucleotide biosynthesis protein A
MHTAVIVAGGMGSRWGLHSGRRKHFVEIDGEPIILRTIRQSSALFDRTVAVVPEFNYVSGVDCEIIAPEETRALEPWKILSSKGEWSSDQTTLLYGDVYFTDSAIKKIAAAEAKLAFLMRWTKSDRTGKPYGEIYAISFAGSMHEQIIAAMEDFTPDPSIPARAGWHLLNRLRDVATMVEIDDETEDFDNAKDYERWMVATGRRG